MSDDDYEDYEDAPPRAKNSRSSKLKKSRSPRTGRVYEHVDCGGATEITEGDFTGLCNPFQPVSRTYCASCSRFVGLGDVAWADTGEPISDFRARMRRKSPFWLTVMQYAGGPLLFAGIGILLCWLFMQPPNRYYLMLGVLVGGPLLWWHLAMPDLGRLASGVEYRNQK